jgi:ABC-2 type transport system permease protein
MSLWRLEWLRLTRTGRLIALVAVFVFFGATSPPLNRYMATLLEHFGNGVQIVAPAPSPLSGFETYTNNAGQIGLLVFVLVVSSAVALTGHAEMAIFLRTRCSSTRDLVLPRFAVPASTGAAAYVLGALVCWYGTVVWLGPVGFGRVLMGAVLGSVYFLFIGAVAAAFGSVFRGVVSTSIATLVVALGVGLAGAFDAVAKWLPGYLTGALTAVAGGGDVTSYGRSLVVTIAASAGLVVVAVRRADRVEL